MKGKLLKLAGFLVIASLLVVAFGCEAEEVVDDNNNEVAEPEETYELIGQGIYESGNPGLELQRSFCRMVEEMSGGRIEMELHPMGAVVGPFEAFDATSEGTLDFNMKTPMWHEGHEPAMIFLTSIPNTFTHHYQLQAWYHQHGGLELAREAYAKHNQHLASIAVYGNPPMGAEVVHSKEPIESVYDYEGLSVRSSGAAAMWFEGLGASVVSMSGDELYTALETGVIDAAEWVGPTANYPLGLHEAADYLITPGLHTALMSSEAAAFNMDVWNELPEDLQKIIEVAGTKYGHLKGHAFEDMDYEYLERMKDENPDLEVITLDDEAIEEAREYAQSDLWPRFEESPYDDDLSQRIWESQQEYMELIGLLD